MKKFVYILLFLCLFAGANTIFVSGVATKNFCCVVENAGDEPTMSTQNINVMTPENIFETNAFRIVRQANRDGTIVLSYIFPINSAQMAKIGVDEKSILVYKFYLTTYINALVQSSKSRESEKVQVSNVMFFESFDGLGYSIAFKNLQAQKEYFQPDENEDGGKNESQTLPKTTTSGFFFKTTCLETTFPISSQAIADNLKLVCEYALTSWANNEGVSNATKTALQNEINGAIYIYDFATTEQNLKSPLMYSSEEFNHNVFIKSYDQLENQPQMNFYTTYPNKPIWYLSAVVVVLAGMGIAFLVLKLKQKRKKN